MIIQYICIFRLLHCCHQVAQQEAENSEDATFVEQVNTTRQALRDTITPMVLGAKSVAQNPQDPGALHNWRNCNQHVSMGPINRGHFPRVLKTTQNLTQFI